MDVVLLLARLVLAGVFLVAGGAKLADRRGSIEAMRGFGVPDRLAAPAGIALPVAEIAVAILLIPTATARWGALGALALLLAFVGGIAWNLAKGNQPDCHCFGQLHSEPAGWPTLIRNGALAAVAAFVLIAGWDDAGASVVGWLGDLSGFEGAMLAIGVVALAVIAVEGWALFHLLQQNGRLLIRLDALEEAIESGPAARPAAPANTGPISGLRVGTPAPSFELPNLAGAQTPLADLIAPDTQTMLVFSDPGCGPCNALMPELARWQQEHAGKLTIAVISRGDLEENRSKAGQHGIRNVLLQKNREIAEAYESRGTPSAVLVRPNMTIGSAVAGGAEAIRGLVATATTAPAVRVPTANGNRPAPPDLVGKPAPDSTLKTLDGAEVALASRLDGPTALLFWNPGCGFCRRMLDDLKALEADPPRGAPKIVVISTGDPGANREQGIQSTVLLDQGFTTGRQYGASGTPSAVLIDGDGKVASTVVVGGPATLELMRGPVGAGAGD